MKVALYEILFTFVWLVANSMQNPLQRWQQNKDNCSGDFWSTQGYEMTSNMDGMIQPCDDYYEYACGNWRASYQLRSLGAHDTLSAIRADNKRLLIQYFDQLEEVQLNGSTRSYQPNVVNFYNSCLRKHYRSDKNEAIKTYTDALHQISRDWPILTNNFQNSSNFSFKWQTVAAEMRRYNVNTLFRLLVQPNWQTSEQKIFYITSPTFEHLKAYPESERCDEERMYLYKRDIKYLMLDLGVRVRTANKIAEEVVQFEKDLMSLQTNDAAFILKEPQFLSALEEQLPYQLNLRDYVKTLLLDVDVPETFNPEDLLFVADISYLRKLANFLQGTKAEIQAKYFLVQFLIHFEVHTRQDDSLNKRKANCLQHANEFMTQELSTLFLQLQHGDTSKYLKSTQSELNEIFARLKMQFEKLLNSTNIFDRDALSRAVGLEKLRAMRLSLPNLQLNENYFNVSENYDQNLLNLSKFKAAQMISEVINTLKSNPIESVGQKCPSCSPVNDGLNAYGPLNVNAYYRLKKNVIELPVGLLRVPIYDDCMKLPKIYGSLVYILAHELLHGFDYDGLNYDKSGNISNGWGAKSIIQFGTKSSCYLSKRYSLASLKINENIADTEGLRLALATYMESLPSAGPGVDSHPSANSDLKLFFLSFAQTWCGESAAFNKHNTDHASHRERVNNAVGNFLEFANVYKCAEHSAMNPQDKCKVW